MARSEDHRQDHRHALIPASAAALGLLLSRALSSAPTCSILLLSSALSSFIVSPSSARGFCSGFGSGLPLVVVRQSHDIQRPAPGCGMPHAHGLASLLWHSAPTIGGVPYGKKVRGAGKQPLDSGGGSIRPVPKEIQRLGQAKPLKSTVLRVGRLNENRGSPSPARYRLAASYAWRARESRRLAFAEPLPPIRTARW